MPIRLALARLAVCAALAAGAIPAARAGTTELLDLPAPAGGALLTLPIRAFGERPRGVVVVLPDAVGPDGRATPYVEALLAHGIGVLELAPSGPADGPPALAAGVTVARQVLARDPRFAAAPVALLGFGEGASVAMAWAGQLPVAALYPRCAAVGQTPQQAENAELPAPLLLLHPAVDPTDRPGACARLAARFGRLAFRHAYADVSPGWDVPPVGDLAGPTLMPRDSASHAGQVPGPRYRAAYHPAVTQDAARRVAWFITAALERRGPWVPPSDR